VPKNPSKANEEEIQAFVTGNVTSYKNLLGGIAFVDHIPKSAAGKILRKDLKALFARGNKG